MKLSGLSVFFLENTRKSFKLILVLVLVLVLKSKALYYRSLSNTITIYCLSRACSGKWVKIRFPKQSNLT